MTSIETSRQQSDLLYHIIVNSEAKTLNDICEKISTYLYREYGDENMSKRLKITICKVCQSSDRVAKHALVFFALYHEPEIRNIFISDTPRVPPQKFKHFVEKELPKLLDKLARGAFTSLRAFVEDTRWTYTTL